MKENQINQIQKISIMNHVSQEEISRCIQDGSFYVKKFYKGEIIHLEGDLCDTVEIVLSGEVVIDSLDKEGNLLTITDFGVGDILGGNLIFSSYPHYPMTITAYSASTLIRMGREALSHLFASNKAFLMDFLKLISDNTSILSAKIKNHINKPLHERIIIFLEHQRKAQESNLIRLGMSKKKLAEKFGVQRTSLSRELKKMKDEGLIDYDRDYIRILKL